MLKCVAVEVVLSDLNVVHIVAHRHVIFKLILNVVLIKCSVYDVILDMKLIHW